MNYKLTIAERLALLNVLPTEGNLVTLRITRELQTNLSFSEEETKEWKIVTQQTKGAASGFVTWDSTFNKETKEIEIGDTAKGIIAEQLTLLEARKQLRMELIDLFEKFVTPKTPPP